MLKKTWRKEYIYLLQVVIVFALLGFFLQRFFYLPALLTLICLPHPATRGWFINRWQHLGVLMGRLIHPVVLSVVYFVFLTPLAFLWRLCGNDPLQLKRPQESTLHSRCEQHGLERFEDLW